MLLDIVTNRTPPPLGVIFFFEPDFEHCQARCMCDYQVFKDRTVTLSHVRNPAAAKVTVSAAECSSLTE